MCCNVLSYTLSNYNEHSFIMYKICLKAAVPFGDACSGHLTFLGVCISVSNLQTEAWLEQDATCIYPHNGSSVTFFFIRKVAPIFGYPHYLFPCIVVFFNAHFKPSNFLLGAQSTGNHQVPITARWTGVFWSEKFLNNSSAQMNIGWFITAALWPQDHKSATHTNHCAISASKY